KNNIAEAVGRVRRTVIRVCQRLEALGIIKQYETKRDGGDRRQSTNVIVIQADVLRISQEVGATCHGSDHVRQAHEVNNSVVQPLDEQTETRVSNSESERHSADVAPDCHTEETPSKNINNNTYKETYISADEVIKRGLRNAIPAPIYDAMAP